MSILTLLGAYGDRGNKTFIRGEDVHRLLAGNYDGGIIDLLPNGATPCLLDGAATSDRAPLTHKRLKQFIQTEFDLEAFGVRPGERVGVLLPNGPELAVTLLSVVSQWCAAPINPTNTWQEIRAELVSTGARAIIILAGAAGNDAALEAAKTLPVGVIVVTPLSSITGLFRLNIHTPTPEPEESTAPAFLQSAPTSPSTNLSSGVELTDVLSPPKPAQSRSERKRQINRPGASSKARNNEMVRDSNTSVSVNGTSNSSNGNGSGSGSGSGSGDIKESPISPQQKLQSGGSRTVLLLHTSGTSGNKKLVPYSQDMVVVGAACIATSWNLSPTDVCLNMMPLFHIGGIMRNIFAPILAGGQVIACSGFDPLLFWDVAQSRGFTWYYAAPTMHHAILMEAERRLRPLPVARVRFIANAAGGLLPALAQALKQTFVHAVILTSYGMTECMPISSPPQSYQLDPQGTSGIPCGPDVLIVDDEWKRVPTGTTGNIMVRSLPCFAGYENNGSANEESFFTIDGQSGWFSTGDCGRMDAQGYLFISGRSKEIINRGGETISPFEIEEAVVKHKSVKETIAFSAPHEQYQETVGCIIVTREGQQRADLPSLQKYLDDKLHRSKWPQVLVFMDALPKNQTGKLLRIRLAERFRMSAINEESSPLSRIFEASCPPVGTPLTSPIDLLSVTADNVACERFLKTEQKLYRVLQAAVVRVDLPFRPDSFAAFVVLNKGGGSTEGTVNAGGSAREVALLAACEGALPRYLVPQLVHVLDTLPLRKEGGDCDREALKRIALSIYAEKSVVTPRNAIEAKIEAVWRRALGASVPLSVLSSFFDLGGDSLKAGQLVNAMRKELRVQLSVADLFAAPTIEGLAHRVSSIKTLGSPSPSVHLAASKAGQPGSTSPASRWRRYFLGQRVTPMKEKEEAEKEREAAKFFSYDHATLLSNTSPNCLAVQLFPLLFVYPMRRIILWFLVAGPWVYFMKLGMGRFRALLCAMFLSRLVVGICMPLLGIAAKWLLIGRYKAGKYPLWGAMYLRWWLVEQIVNIAGKGVFRDDLPIIGSHLVRLYYVMMGATIGSNVKIHKDAKIGTVADLLVIGSDVTIDNATCRPFCVEEGHFVLLPIHIGRGCSVGVKSVLAPGAMLQPGVCLGPLSSSHELNDADPDYRDYCRTAFTQPPWQYIVFLGLPILLVVNLIAYIPWYACLTLMVYNAKAYGWYEPELHTIFHAFLWWIMPQRLFYYFLLRIIKRCVVPFLRLLLVVLLKRNFIGRFRELGEAGKKNPWQLFRYWLMQRLLAGGNLGGVARLVGSHYEIISIIYRLLGADIGQRVYWPGSGLDIVEYDLLKVGDDVVFGSRSVVMTSSVKRSATVTFGAGSMVADRCVLLPGTCLSKGSVLGSGSLAKEDFYAPVGSIWVGSQDGCAVNAAPEDKSYNVKDTRSPFGRAFYGGEADYPVIPLWAIVLYNTAWQGFCTMFRNCPTALSLIVCSIILRFEHYQYHSPFDLFVVTMLAYVPLHASLCVTALGIDIAAKWLLLGRREAGAYPWDQSSYCQRWQLYLTLQEIRRGERRKTGVLDMLQGSQWLCWYFQLLGANIGRNVCLYPNGGDPMMTEPDLVTIGDNSAIDDASLIAHINTRGVFRLNEVSVDKCCVLKSMTRLLSGASMESYSILQEHTLVLAGESVDCGSVWQGWPSRAQQGLEAYRSQLRRHLEVILHQQLIDDNNEAMDTTTSPFIAYSGQQDVSAATAAVGKSSKQSPQPARRERGVSIDRDSSRLLGGTRVCYNSMDNVV